MSTLAKQRLTEERKLWRKDHPYGFHARPKKNADGTLNMMVWECGVPGTDGNLGKKDTPWEGGLYKCVMTFAESYPATPPGVQFRPAIFHPNVYQSGSVCLDIIGNAWKPAITIKQVLLGLQTLLNEPNLDSPANIDASKAMRNNGTAYEKTIRDQAKRFAVDVV